MGHLGARETLIYEKNLKLKTWCQTPFKLQQTVFNGLKDWGGIAYKFYRASAENIAKFYCRDEMQMHTGNPFFAFISAIA